MLIGSDEFRTLVENVGQVIDLAGLGVIVIGLSWATVLGARSVITSREGDEAFRRYRQRVGKAILLGLE